MASSSKHNTTVEKHIQSLCILVYTRLMHADLKLSVVSRVLHRFLTTLDLDDAWLHEILGPRPHAAGNPSSPHIEELQNLVLDLEAQSKNMAPSALIAEVAQACDEVAKLLGGTGRQKEALSWAVFATDCHADAETLKQEEEFDARMRNLRC